MRSLDELREDWRQTRREGLVKGFQNPLKAGGSSRTALLFGLIFTAAGTIFLLQRTPLPLALLEFGYGGFWLAASFLKLHEKLRKNLIKLLVGVIGVYYLLKFI